MTSPPFLMPAQASESALLLVSTGRHGHCAQNGTQMGEISDGQKVSDLNSWSDTSSPLVPPTFISKFSETTEVWLRAGGMDTVKTNPQMTPSNAFIPSWMKQTVPSSPNTFPAERIQQMDPPVAFVPPHISVSRSLLSPMPSSHSSAMSQKMLSPPTAVPPSNNHFRTDQVLSTTRTPPSDSASDQTISRRA